MSSNDSYINCLFEFYDVLFDGNSLNQEEHNYLIEFDVNRVKASNI